MKKYPRHDLNVSETLNSHYLPRYPYRIIRWIKSLPAGTYDRTETLGHYESREQAEQALERFAKKAKP